MNKFNKHLKEQNESYLQHMTAALEICIKMQIAAYAQFIHAIFPFIPPLFGGDIESMKKYLNDIRKQEE